MNPHEPTKLLEAALCDYTGARYAVAVNSCTAALMLAVRWHLTFKRQPGHPERPNTNVEIPSHTYVSVPMSIIHAGGRPTFRDEEWIGAYQLKPYPIWDCARRFYAGMFGDLGDGKGNMLCVSFHAAKILGDTQGGAILHDSPQADVWLRRARFDGRTEGVHPIDDTGTIVGYHCYISPDVSARLLLKLAFLPRDNADLPNDNYPNLAEMEIFR